jgi:hypothetical protein
MVLNNLLTKWRQARLTSDKGGPRVAMNYVRLKAPERESGAFTRVERVREGFLVEPS